MLDLFWASRSRFVKNMCDTATYNAWEQAVIRRFFVVDQRATALIPEPGRPSIASKRKYILAALADDSLPSQVAASTTCRLPTTKRRWYHIGEHKLNHVSDGVHDKISAYFHPCCDLGGLTNYRQRLGKPPVWASPSPEATLDSATDLHALAKMLFARWCELACKKLPPDLIAELQCWLVSVSADMGEAVLRFHPLEPEHRVLVRASDVRAALGVYYLRCFNKGGQPDRHAREATDAECEALFCGVSAGVITPNLNERNITLEYAPYGAEADGKLPRGIGFTTMMRCTVALALVASVAVVLSKR